MRADETTGKGNDFWVLWDRTAHAVRRAREIELRLTADLSGVEASLLAFVKESKGPVTPSVLARQLHREPHTVSGLVSRMEKRGLVKKEKNLGRRNLVRVTLTKKGEEAFKKQGKVSVPSTIMLTALTDKERAALRDYLAKLHKRAVEVIRENQPLPYE
jgi:DNA-binding MarR family transcriptional regulator